VRVDVDLNLMASLTGDVTSGAITFAPQGAASIGGGVSIPLSEFKALVTSSNAARRTLTTNTFADDGQAVPVGTRTIDTSAVLLFLDEDGAVLTEQQFYAALVPNQTLINVQGTLFPSGVVQATRVWIEDQTGGTGSTDRVRIRGDVVGVDTDSLRLRIQNVTDGSQVTDQILPGLSDPGTVDVTFDPDTVFLSGGTQVGDSSALAVGRSVEVGFCSFAASPFPACTVDVSSSAPQLRGTVSTVDGLPGSFVMHLDPSDPAIVGGLVESSTTDVPVDLTTSTILFNGGGNVVLLPADLTPGMELTTRGTLGGTETAPTLTASEVRVSGGFLGATSVASFDEPNSTFISSGGSFVDPFGSSVTSGEPQLILIQPGATFSGSALTPAEFFALLDSPQGLGATVNVRGLPTSNPNEIRAYELHTTLSPTTF